MLNIAPKEFVMVAGLLAEPAVAGFAGQHPASALAMDDPRLSRLQQFFAERNCPLLHLAADFLIAADLNDLDWRLLPSISIVESGGGRAYKNNNVFGWNSGRQRFASLREGIHVIAGKLATSKLYRYKDTNGKLRTYNPRPEWSIKVKTVMQTIGEADWSGAVAALN